MAKKMIIYGVILLLWLVACVVLYVLKLIDWIGVAVSFIFAVPPIFVDLYSNKEESKRKQQLEQKCSSKPFSSNTFEKKIVQIENVFKIIKTPLISC